MKKVLFSLVFGGLLAASASAAPISLTIGVSSSGFNVTANALVPTTLTFSSLTINSAGSSCVGPQASLCDDVAGSTINALVFDSGGAATIFTFGSGADALTYTTSSVWTTSGTLPTLLGIFTTGTYAVADGSFSPTAGSLNISLQAPNDGTVAGNLGKYNFSASGSTVPEPGSMALLGSGLIGLGFIARRRRK